MESRVILTGVVDSTKQIERGFVVFYCVKAESTSKHASQIQALQSVSLEVAAYECEHSFCQIAFVLSAALDGVCRGCRNCGCLTGGVHTVGIEGYVISQRFALGCDRQRQVFGLAIAAGQCESTFAPPAQP